MNTEGRRLLARHGVRAAIEWVPPAERSTGLRCLHAEALALVGDLDAAGRHGAAIRARARFTEAMGTLS